MTMRSRSTVAIVGGIAAVTLGVIWGLPDGWEVGGGPDDNTWHSPDAWEVGMSSDDQGSEWTAVSRSAPNDWR